MDLPFELIDVCFVAILIISGILAYLRGFVREILALVAWIGATLIAIYGFSTVEPLAKELVENEHLAEMLTGVGLFVTSLLILTVIAHLAGSRVKHSAASNFDRSLGFVFGVLRGVVLVSLLYLSAAWYWGRDELPDALTDARTFPLIEGSAELLLILMPEDARAAAESATGIARIKADRAISAEKVLRGLISPAPRSSRDPDSGNGMTGYGTSERSEMQRLIESKQ